MGFSAEEFKRARTELRFTQEQLAIILKTSQSVISQWETGDIVPNEAQIQRIIHLFPSLRHLAGTLDSVTPIDLSYQLKMTESTLVVLQMSGVPLQKARTMLHDLIKDIEEMIKIENPPETEPQ